MPSNHNEEMCGRIAYLTDDAGQVTQTLNYLPYGEDWVDVQNYAETQYPRLGIYRFNGKEKDYESGFHYYGARYYWSETLTGWLSVDPMMDKYPDVTPYNYCHWNPINLIDPDGMDDWKLHKSGELEWDKTTAGNSEDRIVADDGDYVVVANGVMLKSEEGGANYYRGSTLHLSFGNNEENATEVFEFLADHSDVEYSFIGSSSSESDAITSNYEICGSLDAHGDEYGNSRTTYLLVKGVLREHTHNHPNDIIGDSWRDNATKDEMRTWETEHNYDVTRRCKFKTYCKFQEGKYRPYGITTGNYDLIESRVNKKQKQYKYKR